MASSDGVTSVEPWTFRQSFNIDSWLIPDSFSQDSDLLAKALHRSISNDTTTDFFDPAAVYDLSPPKTLSNVSFSSFPELPSGGGEKRKRDGGPGVSGNALRQKRRSRVSSKKSQTTFITADAANFRQMVQQVTGAKIIGSSHSILSPIVKPEPHRLVSRLPPALPTLDTSSFLLNHQNNFVTDLGSASAPIGSFHQPNATATMSAGGGGGSTVDLDTYHTFPTLESWKVM